MKEEKENLKEIEADTETVEGRAPEDFKNDISSENKEMMSSQGPTEPAPDPAEAPDSSADTDSESDADPGASPAAEAETGPAAEAETGPAAEAETGPAAEAESTHAADAAPVSAASASSPAPADDQENQNTETVQAGRSSLKDQIDQKDQVDQKAQKDQTAQKDQVDQKVQKDQTAQKDQVDQKVQKDQTAQKDQADRKDQGGKKKKKKKKASAGRIAFRITLLLFLLALGGIYYYGYEYCGTHFMPNTRINIFDCSGLTEEQVQQRFADAAQDYVLNVRFRGGATEMLSAEDMGFAYKPDGSVAALLQQQDQLVWPKYFFEDSTYNIETGGTYDEDKLMAAVTALPELQEANMEKPENAYIHFKSGNDEEDGVFEIVPDTAGSTIDPVQLAAALGDAASRYEEVVDAEQVPGAYQTAEITKDNPDIVSRCKDLNDIVGASITYEMPDGELIKLNSDVMVNWLVEDKKGRLVKDDDVWDEHLWAFLQELANHGNTLGMKRRFRSTLRGEITVSGGDYGYMVNQIVEHDLLMEDLPACKKETRRPSYYLTPYNEETENDGIGKSYIEVDLAAQHVWCYIDGELKMDCDCVSGNTTDGHATPTGVFGIMFMKKDTTLRGVMQKNGEYEYETKVGYWMPFYDGCGFHDAWWRTAFGGNIYKGDGSHGCVNLPVDGAEALFSYCDEKMPVVVYE